eukprot:12974457-Alexandrium_andersonii.AAC.1
MCIRDRLPWRRRRVPRHAGAGRHHARSAGLLPVRADLPGPRVVSQEDSVPVDRGGSEGSHRLLGWHRALRK